jgi:hypothetical protein
MTPAYLIKQAFFLACFGNLESRDRSVSRSLAAPP